MLNSNKIFTFNHLLQIAALPNLETEILISFLLGKNREYLLTHPEINISPAVYKKFKELEKKRLNNWPLAYLTGRQEFYSLDLAVSPAVLIPRPETEMMVEEIIELIKSKQSDKLAPLLVDLGTGSGAIIISLASEIRRLFPAYFKTIIFEAIDISSAALNIAKANAKHHKLNKEIKFLLGNLLDPLKITTKRLAGRELIITANLPYLTRSQIKEAPTISREPKLALAGGKDGLKYYQELFQQISRLNVSNLKYQIICEIDPSQKIKIKELANKYLSDSKVSIQKDWARKDRFALIKKPV